MESTPPPLRLHSLDALRGADLFWIVGGHELVDALAKATSWGPLVWIESQCHHVEWNGFRFYDLIFPLFLFLAGVSLPLSFAARRKRGASSGSLTRHALTRAFTLVLLGAVYNGLLRLDFEHQRYASVLGRIGLAWLGAALLVIYASPRAQVVWFLGILAGYWALLTWVPAPGLDVVSLQPGETVVDWFDRTLLPGRLHRDVRDPEGLLSTVPAVATALAGVFAGRWMTRPDVGATRRLVGLVLAGLVALGLGKLWDGTLPINKNLWTSSFVLWCAGWSLLLLALFHALIDVAGWRRAFAPFVALGANSILIYLLARFVDFGAIADGALGWAVPSRALSIAVPLGALLLEWALLRYLYRRAIFLRV